MVWVTNNPKFQNFVVDKLFPQWNITYLTTWIWVKVTNNGEPVLPIQAQNRKPYETLIIGYKGYEESKISSENKLIISVPSIHSKKPPLKSILEKIFPLGNPPKVLELFARNLTSGWTCWGNEVLKFQHYKYFKKRSIIE